jgi:hypothetical protein
MNKTVIFSAIAVCGIASATYAADYLWFNRTNGVACGIDISRVQSIEYAEGTTDIAVTDVDNNLTVITNSELVCMSPGNAATAIDIVYSADGVSVQNPYAFDGVSINVDGGIVTVTSTNANELTYHLSGSSSNGAFKIYSDKKYILQLDNLTLTNGSGAVINSQSSKKCSLKLIGESTLVDAKKYTTTPDGEDEKACVFSEGQIVVSGDGILNVTGKKKHALASDDYFEIQSGTVNVVSAASDGIHANDYFLMSGGTYTSANTDGDGIDADAGYIKITGGLIDINIAADDTKGLKCDDALTLSGGDVRLTVSGAQAKGIRTKQTMTMTGGTITATLSGGVVVTDGDPSYCAAIKPQDFNMSGGEINITHTGIAGKGISVDGNCTFTGGSVTISASGAGGVYKDANGDNDSYSSTCISVDGDLSLLAGSFTLSNSGSAGKCIKVDNAAIFGDDTNSPKIEAKTTGKKIAETSSSGSSWGGWGPGGNGNSTDYANPKVIKAGGNLTVNNGEFTLTSTTDGGEGLESKSILTINGGSLVINTYDDCINASNNITINGGQIYCRATNNDGIDSNGTITITGGTIIAIGASSPECGIDCDNNTFKITGGTIFTMGGSTSSPTSSACTQRVVKYTATVSASALLTVTDSNGNHVMSFKNPLTSSGSQVMLISSPKFMSGTTYKIYTGGSVTGGEIFQGLTTNGSYTAGTQSTTFTPSSMVTTVGSSNSWGRP